MKTYFASKPQYPLPDIEGSWQYVKYPCACEVKYDGEFDYLVGNGNVAILINKYGRVRQDLAITQELKAFTGVLAGELYYATGKSFYEEMLSHKFADELRFCAFDILQYGENWVVDEPLHYRRRLLELIEAGRLEHTRIAEQVICKDKPAVMQFYDKVVAQGYEGIVVKNLDSRFVNGLCQSWFKLKRHSTADLFVLGLEKGKVAIVVGTEAKVPLCSVGNAGRGFLEVYAKVKEQQIIAEDKEYLYVEPKYVVEVKYQEILKTGKLRHPVFLREREQGKEVSV